MRFSTRVAIGCAAALLAGGAAATARAGEADAGHRPLRERAARYLQDRQWPDGLVVAAIATLPVIELRGAVPVGINVLGMPWWEVLPLAVAGNMVPVPFILWLMGPLSRLGMRSRTGRRFFEWLFARTRRKTAGLERYKMLGLAVFVAIPLPATGAWTGAMAADLLGIGLRHALWSILLGVVAAGGIMTVLSLMGWAGAAVAGVVLIGLTVAALGRALKREAPGP